MNQTSTTQEVRTTPPFAGPPFDSGERFCLTAGTAAERPRTLRTLSMNPHNRESLLSTDKLVGRKDTFGIDEDVPVGRNECGNHFQREYERILEFMGFDSSDDTKGCKDSGLARIEMIESRLARIEMIESRLARIEMIESRLANVEYYLRSKFGDFEEFKSFADNTGGSPDESTSGVLNISRVSNKHSEMNYDENENSTSSGSLSNEDRTSQTGVAPDDNFFPDHIIDDDIDYAAFTEEDISSEFIEMILGPTAFDSVFQEIAPGVFEMAEVFQPGTVCEERQQLGTTEGETSDCSSNTVETLLQAPESCESSDSAFNDENDIEPEIDSTFQVALNPLVVHSAPEMPQETVAATENESLPQTNEDPSFKPDDHENSRLACMNEEAETEVGTNEVERKKLEEARVLDKHSSLVENHQEPVGQQKDKEVAKSNSFMGFQCSICLKYFRHKSTLSVHQRNHTGEHPFKCKTCQKGFSSPYHLKRHERCHSGERPYECSVCKRAFVRKDYLKKHEQNIHVARRPYQCKVCKETLKTKHDLIIHKRAHKPQLQCKVCKKKFTQQSNLKSHETIHTGEKPYQCEKCHKNFRKRSNLRDHERTHNRQRPSTIQMS